ncbi:unnamed protein product [Lasius platythorax]|uniref:Uncharacterized protein n=1 Tax=Lasius platythorax TaxID=488582 RepID=A0AAV2P407_9HYME
MRNIEHEQVQNCEITRFARCIGPDRMTVPRGSTTDRHILRAGSNGGTYLFIVAAAVAALSDVSNFLLALVKSD